MPAGPSVAQVGRDHCDGGPGRAWAPWWRGRAGRAVLAALAGHRCPPAPRPGPQGTPRWPRPLGPRLGCLGLASALAIARSPRGTSLLPWFGVGQVLIAPHWDLPSRVGCAGNLGQLWAHLEEVDWVFFLLLFLIPNVFFPLLGISHPLVFLIPVLCVFSEATSNLLEGGRYK